MQELGFKAAVEEWLCSSITEKHGLVTSVEDRGCPCIEEETACILFRAIRELSMNVVKHAHAQSISVVLSKHRSKTRVLVSDDGIGFDPDECLQAVSHDGGYGLFSIKERLSYMGGSFDIKSKPGKGTDVVMIVPSNDTK